MPNPNVKFLRGTQTALNKYLREYTGSSPATAEEGCFYLTEDTNRLYIGKQVSNGTGGTTVKAVPVNQGVIPVANVSDLPNSYSDDAAGQFYYVVNGNILAVATGGQWIQINQNSNDNDFIYQRSIVGTYDSTNHKAVVADTLYNTSSQQPDITSQIEYQGSNGFDVSISPKYVATTKYKSGLVYYKESSGSYVVDSTITSQDALSGKNYTVYIQRGYILTLIPAIYNISAASTSETGQADIIINDGTNKSDVLIQQGNNITVATGDGYYKPTSFIPGETYYTYSSGTGTYSQASTQPTASNWPATNSTYYVKRNAITITGNRISALTGSTGSGGTNNGFTFTATNSIGGASPSGSIDPIIKIGTNPGTSAGYHFESGIATLPVYTMEEIDARARLFNAMEYQGTLTQSEFNTLKTSSNSVKSGYTWIASEDFSDDSRGLDVKAGDLIIASGTEATSGTNAGFIPAADITWQSVAGGANYDTVPKMIISSGSTAPTGGFILQKSTNGTDVTVGTYAVAVNASGASSANHNVYLSATDEFPSGTTNYKIVRITHSELHTADVAGTAATASANGHVTVATATSDTTQTTAAVSTAGNAPAFTIPVPTIGYDKAGHITGITYHSYVIQDTHATISNSISGSVSSTSEAVITSNVSSDNVNHSDTMSLKSQTIEFSVANNDTGNITMNIVWGTFN